MREADTGAVSGLQAASGEALNPVANASFGEDLDTKVSSRLNLNREFLGGGRADPSGGRAHSRRTLSSLLSVSMYTTGRGGWHLDTQSDVPDAIRPWPCKEHPLDATCILLNPDVSDGHRAVHHPLDGLACQASLGRFLKRPNDARPARASVGCFATKLRALGTESILMLCLSHQSRMNDTSDHHQNAASEVTFYDNSPSGFLANGHRYIGNRLLLTISIFQGPRGPPVPRTSASVSRFQVQRSPTLGTEPATTASNLLSVNARYLRYRAPECKQQLPKSPTYVPQRSEGDQKASH
ncbi:hypothetical protein PGT21_016515 [Puccinia graminis f. sp. tritici]|uniref:Uncharacterized protein n=1 Tax=Puccinia graminis f. sp. tritici TaxID=56615 RepID=A0A5B0NQT8_PUCGR|nr:hypothetical protein PGT21_016515 [Puccinia graminis f. sp. tritici]